MNDKPIVMPTLLDNEPRSTARKLQTSGPSMPAGSMVWVEVNGRWVKTQVQRIEFAVVHLRTT